MTASPPTPKYYVASNRVGGRLLLVWPLVGGALAIVLGLVYAFVAALITQVFESPPAFVVATPLYGAALAMAGRAVCYLGQVRRPALRLPILISVGVLSYLASWHFYLNLFDTPPPFNPAPSWTMSPVTTFHLMVQWAGFQGWESLCWLLEIACVFGFIVYLQESDDDPETPFCEKCNEWTSQVWHLELADSAATAAADQLKASDAIGLAKLKRKPSGSLEWALVRIFRCRCGASRYVCVDRAKKKIGKSASVRQNPYAPAGQRGLYLDLGSPDETDFTSVLENLELSEAEEKTLETMK